MMGISVSNGMFREAMLNVEGTEAYTENGALSNATTQSACLDLFYATVRGLDGARYEELLDVAWEQHPLYTLKCVAYVRDVRGGKGERSLGRRGLAWLARKSRRTLEMNVSQFLGVFGRYDDLLEVAEMVRESGDRETARWVQELAVERWARQLAEDMEVLKSGGQSSSSVSLCAKWVPGEKSAWCDKWHVNIAAKVARAMGYGTAAEWRKRVLSPLRAHLDVLERHMCAKEWSAIEYGRVPSVAMLRHGKKKGAFVRNDGERFAEYKAKLVRGEEKVNVGALHPHQIVEQYYVRSVSARDDLVEGQWAAFVEKTRALGKLGRTMVLADVSGSMKGMPMLISITMAILFSSVCESAAFRDLFLTFETVPKFHDLSKCMSLYEKVMATAGAPWGGTTNLQKAFDVMLRRAARAGVSADEMPERLIIVSDMQFNVACSSNAKTNLQVIRNKYREAGYKFPHVVFWNVRANTTDVPAKMDDEGVSLVSGFSVEILSCLLDGELPTPWKTFVKAMDVPRYEQLQVCQ